MAQNGFTESLQCIDILKRKPTSISVFDPPETSGLTGTRPTWVRNVEQVTPLITSESVRIFIVFLVKVFLDM